MTVRRCSPAPSFEAPEGQVPDSDLLTLQQALGESVSRETFAKISGRNGIWHEASEGQQLEIDILPFLKEGDSYRSG